MKQGENEKFFQLVFEGPIDQSPETIRRLKTAFLVDLNLAVDEIQRILTTAPLTILKGEKEEDLSVAFETLKGAGGKVLVVKPKGDLLGVDDMLWNDTKPAPKEVPKPQFNSDLPPIPLDLGEEETKPAPRDKKSLSSPQPNDHDDDEDEEGGVLFEMDSEEFLKEPQKKREPKTYVLPMEDEDLTDMHSDDGTPLFTPEIIQKNPVLPLNVKPSTETPEPPILEVTKETEVIKETIETPKPELEKTPLEQPIEKNEEIMPNTDSPALEAISMEDVHEVVPPPTVEEEKLPNPTASSPLAFGFDEEAEESTDIPVHTVEASAPTPKVAETKPVLFETDEDEIEISPSVTETKEAAPAKLETAQKNEISSTPSPISAFSTEEEEDDLFIPEEPKVTPAPQVVIAKPTLNVEEPPEVKETKPLSQAKEVVEEKTPSTKVETKTPEEATPPAPSAEPHEELHAPIRKSKKWSAPKFKVPNEILLPVILGAIVLGLGNWIYFNYFASAPSKEELTKLIAQTVAAHTSSKAEKIEKPVIKPAPDPVFMGAKDNGTNKVTTEFSIKPDKTLVGSFKIETPKPAELTPEQIGRHESVPIWIRKIEIDGIQVVPDDDGTFDGTGTARVYLEEAQTGNRLIATGKFSGKIAEDKKHLTVSLSVAGVGTPPSEGKLIERSANGDYRLLVESELEASLQQ